MGLRETLNRNPAITTGATIAVIVIALIAIFWQTFGGKGHSGPVTASFFTTDDGATWFSDSVDQIPPFMKDGKEAVRAYVFKCSDGKPFVAYLERYTPQAKKVVEQARIKAKENPKAPPDPALFAMTMQGGTEVKKPKDPSGWVQRSEYQKYGQVVQITCPDGKLEDLEPVLP